MKYARFPTLFFRLKFENVFLEKGLQHGRWKCLKVGGASSVRGHGERVEREPITEVWGQSPQRGPGAKPLVGGQEGFAP